MTAMLTGSDLPETAGGGATPAEILSDWDPVCSRGYHGRAIARDRERP